MKLSHFQTQLFLFLFQFLHQPDALSCAIEVKKGNEEEK